MKKIITTLKHIYRGSMCELPNFGYHPGTGMLIILILAFTAALGWAGLIFSSIAFLPIYFWGSYRRSVEDPET